MTTTVASLEAVFTANTSALEAGIDRVKGGLSGLVGSVGGGMQQIGGAMTKTGGLIAAGIAPVVAFGAKGIQVVTGFDSALAELGARAGLTEAELAEVEARAISIGASTAFSAADAAQGFLELTTSGMALNDAMAVLPVVMDLAAAGGLSLKEAADLATDAMTIYGLSVEDATALTDLLVGAAGVSSSTVAMLGDAFTNVAPLAASLGIPIEDLTAMLVLLSEGGVKGAEAGTQLKSMLMNMMRDTPEVIGAWEELGMSIWDAQGTLRPMNDILDDLRTRLTDGSMTMEDQNRIMSALFGSYGRLAAEVLLAGGSIEDVNAAIEAQESAAAVAEARLDTFAGSVEELQGSVETLMIKALRPFMNNHLRPIVRQVTSVVNSIADWAAAHPGVVRGIGMVTVGLAALSAGLITAGGIVSFFGVALSALLSPVTLVIAAIAGLALAFKTDFLGIRTAAEPVFDWLTNTFNEVSPQLKGIWNSLKEGDISGAVSKVGDLARDIKGRIEEELPGIRAKLQEWGDEFVNWIGPKIEPALTELGGFLLDVGVWIGNAALDLASWLMDWAQEFVAWVSPMIPQVLDELGALASDVLNWIFSQASELGLKLLEWGDEFLNWVSPVIPLLLVELGALALDVLNWIGEQTSELATKLTDWAQEFVAWADDLDVIGKLARFALGIYVWIGDQVIKLDEYLLEWATEFVDWLGDATRDILPKLGEYLGTIANWVLGTAVPELAGYLIDLTWELVAWVVQATIDIMPKLWDFIVAVGEYIITDLVPALVGYALNLGGAIITGMVEGVIGIGAAIWEKIKEELPTWEDVKNWILGNDTYNPATGNAQTQGGSAYMWPTDPFGSPQFFGGAGGTWRPGQAPTGSATITTTIEPSGHSAGGGPAIRGQARIVGETGPELFVPPTSGQILTSSQLASATSEGRQVIISGGTFILQGIQDAQQLFDQLKRIGERRA